MICSTCKISSKETTIHEWYFSGEHDLFEDYCVECKPLSDNERLGNATHMCCQLEEEEEEMLAVDPNDTDGIATLQDEQMNNVL